MEKLGLKTAKRAAAAPRRAGTGRWRGACPSALALTAARCGVHRGVVAALAAARGPPRSPACSSRPGLPVARARRSRALVTRGARGARRHRQPARPRLQRQHRARLDDELGELVGGLQLARRPAAARAPGPAISASCCSTRSSRRRRWCMVLTNAARAHRLQQHRRAPALHGGRKLEGLDFAAVLADAPRRCARPSAATATRCSRWRSPASPRSTTSRSAASCSTPSRTGWCC